MRMAAERLCELKNSCHSCRTPCTTQSGKGGGGGEAKRQDVKTAGSEKEKERERVKCLIKVFRSGDF